MPRYFFHLSFGQRVMPDEEGVELPSRTAARDEALAVVRDLANPKVESGPRRWASWFLEVADEGGRFFRTPIGHPALELVTPEGREGCAEQPHLKPAHPAAGAALPEDAVRRARVADIVREMAARQQRMAELLRDNVELQRELSSVCLASERIRVRTRHLLARAARSR